MIKITDRRKISLALEKSKYKDMLKSLDADIFLAQYDAGEFLIAPWHKDDFFQLVLGGNLSIYYVRDDGSRFALASGTLDYVIGDMELASERIDAPSENIYAEAMDKVTTIAFSLKENREKLISNVALMQFVAKSLAEKLSVITTFDARSASLEERVISYMEYKCENNTLKGIENASFHLHCSSRQLQRIMNGFEERGMVEKIGKGKYRLIVK